MQAFPSSPPRTPVVGRTPVAGMKRTHSMADTSVDTLCITPKRTLFNGITIKIEEQELPLASTPPTSPAGSCKDEINVDEALALGYHLPLSGPSSPPSLPRYRVAKRPADRRAVTLAAPWTPLAPSKANRWCERDDYIISVLKEAFDLPWRRIADFIDNRHSWQAVQMRYLRTLKSRNQRLTAEESTRFMGCLKRDWETRFHRIAYEMGNGFSVNRCIKHAFAVIGMPEFAGPVCDPGDEEAGRFNAHGMAPPTSEHDFPDMDDSSELSDIAVELLEQFTTTNVEALATMYLLPRQLTD